MQAITDDMTYFTAALKGRDPLILTPFPLVRLLPGRGRRAIPLGNELVSLGWCGEVIDMTYSIVQEIQWQSYIVVERLCSNTVRGGVMMP
jgi:hypothetical protein